MPDYEVLLKRVAPQTIASAREVAPTLAAMDQFCRSVEGLVDASGVRKVGPWMNIYHHEGFRDEDLDVEAAVPVDGAPAEELNRATGGRVKLRELPGVETMASLSYEFSPETLAPAYGAISAWIHANGYEIVGPCREIYIGEIAGPPSALTEIQFPVARAAARPAGNEPIPAGPG